jgi:hypothetical protein
MHTMTDRRTAATDAAVVPAIAAALASAVVFAVAALVVSAVLDRDRYEQAVIGLTQASEWPFHDVHLATAAGQLDDGSLVEMAQRELGLPLDPEDVALDGERQDGTGILRITARAPTSSEAALLANTVADAVIDVVPPDTPVQVVDRADGRAPSASRLAIGGAGAAMGFVLGVVLWPGAVPSRSSGRSR